MQCLPPILPAPLGVILLPVLLGAIFPLATLLPLVIHFPEPLHRITHPLLTLTSTLTSAARMRSPTRPTSLGVA